MSRRPLAAPVLYLVTLVLTAAVLTPFWRFALVVELVFVAWRISKRPTGKWCSRLLALWGGVRLAVALPIALFAHPVSAPLHGLGARDFVGFLQPQMIVAAFQILASMIPFGLLFAVLFAFVALPLARERGKADWVAFAFVASLIPLLVLFEPIETRNIKSFRREALVDAVGLRAFDMATEELGVRALPSSLPTDATVQRVTFVMLESVGSLNVLAHLERVPDGPFAHLIERGAFYERVLSASNASHMAQPAALASREFSRGVSIESAKVPESPLPHWSFARHFKAKGFRTVMVSSQDETWLGMNAVTMSPAFDEIRHAPDETDHSLTYVDACGTRKVFDSETMRRYAKVIEEESGPLFTYLNLQNSHFPYIVESETSDALRSELTCSDQHFGPAWRVALARHRYNQALDASLERLAHAIASEPGTLFVLTGDHGESMKGGLDFAHAHSPIPDQMETFALFIGPGVEPGREPQSISSLDLLPTTIAMVSPDDLATLPRDLLQGIDARTYGQRPRLQLSVSYGLQPTSYAVDSGPYWYRASADEKRCERNRHEVVPLEHCTVHQEALSHWLSCKEAFFARADHRDYFEPCWRLTRERYSEGAPVRRPPFAGEARAE